MQNGALYQRSNEVQRRDAKQTLDDYSHLFQWRPDGRDSLLDIGCGSGDVTIDYVLPMLPSGFTRLVGADISDGMLNYARNNFHHSKISFEKLDIGSPLGTIQYTPFDHITSFYCLHWVQNQKQAIRNIFDLLADDGDCLLVFLAANPIFEIYKRMCVQQRWSRYMEDVSSFISPYQFSSNPSDDFERILFAAGFTECSVQVQDKQFVYEGHGVLRKSVRAVTPFFEGMSEDQQEQFLDDYIDIVQSMQLADTTGSDHNTQFTSPYKLIVAYARK